MAHSFLRRPNPRPKHPRWRYSAYQRSVVRGTRVWRRSVFTHTEAGLQSLGGATPLRCLARGVRPGERLGAVLARRRGSLAPLHLGGLAEGDDRASVAGLEQHRRRYRYKPHLRERTFRSSQTLALHPERLLLMRSDFGLLTI